MAGCCGCCSALKPRYKRLVDNIFPANPEDGLQKNNMAQLTFFAVSSPDKLDKIGQYMEQRLSREVHRHKIEYVFIAMEACDQLLKSCHAQSLNLFVESFLKMVQKLLESEEPELQILATNSFVKFANIEEDTPSYHRRYDFFVQRFSTMCHNNNPDQEMRTRIRSVGLRGLQGVVRKTVTDDLQVNIWDPIHMDKIVPSLLFNMHDSSRESSAEVESPRDEEHPSYVAENVLRDLVCRAAYGNIKSSITPVLVHLDNHKLWQPNSFAKKCFKIIMYSIQAQHGYLVIQMLMSHLDKHTHSDPMIKAGIIGVLYETVIISVGGTIGPSVLEVFNNLLRHLSISLDRKSENEERRKAEKIFEEAIINTIGEFANSLPDFQKIEIMMFILGKFPQFTNDDDICGPMDTQLQIHLLKTLLKVATRYKTVVMQNAFPHEFMHPLLQISRLDDPGMRITVQEILQTLIDRNGNSNKLNRVYIPKNISELELRIEKSSRQDIMFMKKNGLEFYWFLYENMQMLSNTVENFEALYCTMGLIYIELGENDILIELIRLALDIQQTVMNNSSLPLTHKCAIHALIAAYLNLISQSTDLPDLRQYIQKVIKTREKEAPHLLPNFAYNRTNRPHSYPTHDVLKDSWLFDHNAISKNLTDSGLDTARLSSPLTQKPFGLDLTEMQSVSDIQSINIDIESVDGSPVFGRKSDEEITVESLKRMLVEDNLSERLDKDRRRTEIHNSFRQAPFEELIARSEAKSPYHNKLNEILDMEHTPNASPISFEMQFPDLFVY